jgi:glycosyltransferase involved in cell wall biosynthesis
MSTIRRGSWAPLIVRGDTPLRIAQIAPLCESVPPTLYGGTERIVSFLTEELVSQGHAVTLFASGDSVTAAELVPCSPVALRLDKTVRDALPWHLSMLEMVRQRAREFDILHFHVDLLQFPLLRELGVPALTTLHGRLDLADLTPFYRVFADARLVSISDDQRRPMPPVNWLETVYHGLPADLLRFQPSPEGDYIAFLGRISPEKRPDRAIEIARRAGMRLRIAAKIDKVDQQYWTEVIEPMVRENALVEFVGEIGDEEKQTFLGDAAALVFPIDWPEPFGIVMIEAMACGTPVLAFACGSVPEVIDNGISGYLVETIDEAVEMLPKAIALDRAGVRAAFNHRFTAGRMARDYLSIYRRLVASAPEMAREAVTAMEFEGEYATRPAKIGRILADRPHGLIQLDQNL